MADVQTGSLPFREQIAFFRQKQNIGTRAWTDIWQEQHDRAFMVAGAMKKELLNDLRNAVDKVIADGVTLEEFRKDFDEIVADHGWSYNGGRNWRTRVIYDTNLRTSYQAGRFAQLNDPDLLRSRPNWMYVHSDLVVRPREEHLAWDGLILRHDDPFWNTHYPPNGWGCKCKVRSVSNRQLRNLGKTGPDTPPEIVLESKTVGVRGASPRTVRVPKGIDPGWAHTPGRSWFNSFSPPPLDDLLRSSTPLIPASAKPSFPASRKVPASRVMADGLDEQEYIDAFLGEFGITANDRNTIFEDVAGEFLVVGEDLFLGADGKSKILKRGRSAHVLLLADTIKVPDEIWLDWIDFNGKQVLRRRYIARFDVEDNDIPTMAVFETGPQGWAGVTAFNVEEFDYVEHAGRRGKRIYVRN